MELKIEGIPIAAGDFAANVGGIYALVCKDAGPVDAVDAAHRFAIAVGYGEGEVATEQFVYQRDLVHDALGKTLTDLSASSWAHSGAVIVIPSLSKRCLGATEEVDQVDVASFLFTLAKQLGGLRFPCFVPFHTVDLCVDEGILGHALGVMGFTRVEVSFADEWCMPELMGTDAIAEAAAMAMANLPASAEPLEGEE